MFPSQNHRTSKIPAWSYGLENTTGSRSKNLMELTLMAMPVAIFMHESPIIPRTQMTHKDFLRFKSRFIHFYFIYLLSLVINNIRHGEPHCFSLISPKIGLNSAFCLYSRYHLVEFVNFSITFSSTNPTGHMTATGARGLEFYFSTIVGHSLVKYTSLSLPVISASLEVWL